MIAGTLAADAHPGSYNGNDAQRGNLVSFDWQTAGSERTSIVDEPGATRGLSSSKTLAIAFTQNTRDEVRQIGGDGQIAGALAAETGMHQTNYVAFQSSQSDVRRLTPTECERLQGFPDGHTAGQSDSARYRQLGNAVAVPVARWIGTRIMEVLS